MASPAVSPDELTVEADRIVYDDAARTVEAVGRVTLAYRGIGVRADVVRVDLDAGRVEARGHVIILDSQGREMRGDVLVYDARHEAAELAPAETIVSGVYVRAAQVRATRERIEATDATLTTCHPAAPPYRVTAQRLEVIPDDRVTAYGATLWAGRHWLLGLPVLVVSLRSPQETAGSFPSVGYNNVDGLWAAYRYAFPTGTPRADVSAALGTLAQRVEGGLSLSPQPLAGSFLWSAAVRYGWHREQGTGVETTRLRYEAGVHLPPVALGPTTEARAAWTWRQATYATGDRLETAVADVAVTHRLGPQALLSLTHAQLRPAGTTPLAVDVVNPADIVDRVTLAYETSGLRDGTVATRFSASASYDFLTETPSVGVSYGERIPGAYHWTVGPAYNLTTRATTLRADVGWALGTDAYVTVRGTYNTTTTLFEDLDYILTAQVEGCFELSVEYRQVRQELWVSLGLAAFPQAQVQFQFRGP
ncbi:MAG: hypothetical protein QN155_08995 [Armatimonadota bacterium]|nr:hypothetical protein [Armatimonadota bacterium]MDR7404295.1 hypothetical protein [Armatimonadota bacterium]